LEQVEASIDRYMAALETKVFGKQDALPALLSLDEATHRKPRSSCREILT
jgi:hypothetical protein